jgi:deoxyribose-phosphate aldolase
MTIVPSIPSASDLARMIDHSLLPPTLTDDEIRAGLALARRLGCAAACVKPYSVPLASEALAGSNVRVCAVAGFPHGNAHIASKVAESVLAIDEGATEIDVVVNVGKVLGGDFGYVKDEVRAVNDACVTRGAQLKLIFENDFLDDACIVKLCELCTELGVAFAKTSTGFGFARQPSGDFNQRGATEAHVALMRRHCGPEVAIKAAGGIRTLDALLRLRALGATRFGSSATESILAEAERRRAR